MLNLMMLYNVEPLAGENDSGHVQLPIVSSPLPGSQTSTWYTHGCSQAVVSGRLHMETIAHTITFLYAGQIISTGPS